MRSDYYLMSFKFNGEEVDHSQNLQDHFLFFINEIIELVVANALYLMSVQSCKLRFLRITLRFESENNYCVILHIRSSNYFNHFDAKFEQFDIISREIWGRFSLDDRLAIEVWMWCHPILKNAKKNIPKIFMTIPYLLQKK